MPRTCTVCHHSQREAIDQALIAGGSYRSIAQQFAASPDAVYRHQQTHLPPHLCQARAVQDVTQADALMAKVQTLEADAKRIQAAAEATGDFRTALQGIRELVRIIELQAKLLGELQEGQTVNLLVLPQWQELRTALLLALVPYPEARAAVTTALLQGSSHGHHNGIR